MNELNRQEDIKTRLTENEMELSKIRQAFAELEKHEQIIQNKTAMLINEIDSDISWRGEAADAFARQIQEQYLDAAETAKREMMNVYDRLLDRAKSIEQENQLLHREWETFKEE